MKTSLKLIWIRTFNYDANLQHQFDSKNDIYHVFENYMGTTSYTAFNKYIPVKKRRMYMT